jgi:methylmalonyl-CoA/ethylmalonyl-CoA epimerase
MIHKNGGGGNTILDILQNVNVCFLQSAGAPLLELVEPVDQNSPVSNILKKVGVAPYHLCYEVDNLEDSIQELENNDFKLLVEPIKAIAFDDRKICFLYHVDVGLIELLEKQKQNDI